MTWKHLRVWFGGRSIITYFTRLVDWCRELYLWSVSRTDGPTGSQKDQGGKKHFSMSHPDAWIMQDCFSSVGLVSQVYLALVELCVCVCVWERQVPDQGIEYAHEWAYCASYYEFFGENSWPSSNHVIARYETGVSFMSGANQNSARALFTCTRFASLCLAT